jgi:hypothetical protein
MKMNNEAASDRKSIKQDQADLKRLNSWKSIRLNNIQKAAVRLSEAVEMNSLSSRRT